MNVTGTGVAVALAVAIALGLLFLGPQLFAFFGVSRTGAPSSEMATTTNSLTSTTQSMNEDQSQPTLGAIPTPAALPTELTVTDTVVGTGAEAKAGDTVTVDYVGMLPDGTVFDASKNHGGTFSFQLGAGHVIKGWDVGVAGMKEGGKRHLIIPADMAYGNQAVGGVIPANATLIFDVTLVKVGK